MRSRAVRITLSVASILFYLILPSYSEAAGCEKIVGDWAGSSVARLTSQRTLKRDGHPALRESRQHREPGSAIQAMKPIS
jgi:hypothetical protein